MDQSAFFAGVRSSLFGGSLSQKQVDGLNAVIEASKGFPLAHLAYMLATTLHEVGREFQPTSENLNYTSAARIRAVWPSRFPTLASAQPYVRNPQKLANKVYAGRMGNGPEASGDGWRYRGRGYCQVTGKSNYAWAAGLTALDLIGNPDLLLKSDAAATVMAAGMMLGKFTGKKLSDYLDGPAPDYVNARRIINSDVAVNGARIAGYARQFEEALRKAGYSPQEAAPEPVEPVPAPSVPEPAEASPRPSLSPEAPADYQDLPRNPRIEGEPETSVIERHPELANPPSTPARRDWTVWIIAGVALAVFVAVILVFAT